MEEYKCPHCVDERLVKSIGNLLVCPSCDVVFVEEGHTNDPVGRMELIDGRY